MSDNPTRREVEAVLRRYEVQDAPVDLEATCHFWIDRAMDAEERIDFAEAKAIAHGIAKEEAQEQLARVTRRYDSLRRALAVLALINMALILWLVCR